MKVSKLTSRIKLTKIAGERRFSCLATGGAKIDLLAFIGFI